MCDMNMDLKVDFENGKIILSFKPKPSRKELWDIAMFLMDKLGEVFELELKKVKKE